MWAIIERLEADFGLLNLVLKDLRRYKSGVQVHIKKLNDAGLVKNKWWWEGERRNDKNPNAPKGKKSFFLRKIVFIEKNKIASSVPERDQ